MRLLCDITVMAEDARIGDTHVSRVGLVAGDGGTVIWPLLIGINKAKEYLIRGTLAEGQGGRADWTRQSCRAAFADVLSKAREIAIELANGPTWAIRWTKLSINQIVKDRVNMLLEASMALEQVTFETADHKEATHLLQGKAQAEIRSGIALHGCDRASERRHQRRCSAIPCAAFSRRTGMRRSGKRTGVAGRYLRNLERAGRAGRRRAGLRPDRGRPSRNPGGDGGTRTCRVSGADVVGRAHQPGAVGARANAAADLLDKLHAGTARVAFCFGALDPDPGVGSIRINGLRATGVLRFVEVASEKPPIFSLPSMRPTLHW